MKAKNWDAFPIDPERIDAILLTHAHIDHVGYLPRLVSQGFRGPIVATQATCALLELLLPDAAYLQEQEAAYANKAGYSRHRPALPLFTARDAETALRLLQPAKFDEPQSLDSATARWRPSGHILGASILEVTLEYRGNARKIVFSGDLGRYHSEIMKPPSAIPHADVLLIESTYGGRIHDDEPIESLLSSHLQAVTRQRGVLLIPAFAIGRTQQILYWIRKVQNLGLAPDIPVYIDSPMAVEASHLYCRFGDDHNLDVNLLMDDRECPLRCLQTHFITAVEDSKSLNTLPGPAVIISASGMCTGGRILHHLKWRLPDPRNRVLFIGFQAEGTRGRQLLESASLIRIHGQEIAVHASITSIDALSAHADHEELLRWAGEFTRPPDQAFVVHGEAHASQALQQALEKTLGWRAIIPVEAEAIDLTA